MKNIQIKVTNAFYLKPNQTILVVATDIDVEILKENRWYLTIDGQKLDSMPIRIVAESIITKKTKSKGEIALEVKGEIRQLKEVDFQKSKVILLPILE